MQMRYCNTTQLSPNCSTTPAPHGHTPTLMGIAKARIPMANPDRSPFPPRQAPAAPRVHTQAQPSTRPQAAQVPRRRFPACRLHFRAQSAERVRLIQPDRHRPLRRRQVTPTARSPAVPPSPGHEHNIPPAANAAPSKHLQRRPAHSSAGTQWRLPCAQRIRASVPLPLRTPS